MTVQRDAIGPVEQSRLDPVVDLIVRHDWLSGSALSRGQYAIDTDLYFVPSARHINRSVLKQRLERRIAADDEPSLAGAVRVVEDNALISDCYAIVRRSAVEEALASMTTVFAEHLPAAWQAVPVALDAHLCIGAEDDVPRRIDELLQRARSYGKQSELHHLMAQFVNISRVLNAADRAFKAAAIVLMSVDIEDDIADLLFNEVRSGEAAISG